MNSNKKNISGGWILCPSKTFPGKFYYFNVLNGEAAWSLEDAEKKTIPKVQDSHQHPEPTSPPTETIPKLSLNQKPVFGQSLFNKLTKPTEKLLWTPIQISPKIDETKKQNLPIKQKTMWNFSNDLFIHSCNKPLSQRFINFEDPIIKFDEDNKIQNKQDYNTNNNKVENAKTNNDIQSYSVPETKPQRKLIKEAVFNIEVPSQTENEPKKEEDRVEIGKEQNFGGDLRNLLLAKKRKTINTDEVESKKPKMRLETTPKKKVTFSLDHGDLECDGDDIIFTEKYLSTIEVLRNLSMTTRWCIVVDGEILLEEFSFLDKLVQLDVQCKLLIPSSALSYVSAASRGSDAAAARTILRRLDTPYIIVQSEAVESNSSGDIIKSCLDYLYRNIHVVLISKDLDLLVAAKRYSIHCFHINSIKNGLTTKPEYKQNMKITICNPEAKVEKPSFGEVLKKDKLNESILTTDPKLSSGIYENSFTSPNLLFNQSLRVNNNNLIQYSPKQKSIANSQNKNVNVTFNDLLNPTQEKFTDVSNGERNEKMLTDWRYPPSDITETTIELDMKNLNLKEKYQSKENVNKNISYVIHSTPNTQKFNGSSMFHNCSENNKNNTFDVQKSNITLFQNDRNTQNINFEVPKSKMSSPLLKNSGKNIQDSIFFPKRNILPAQNASRNSHFESQISKEPQCLHLKIDKDVFKKPVEPLNQTKTDKELDLRNFCVKNKVMENRLSERMDEFLCTFKQIMEDFLTSILVKLPAKTFKALSPPWSLYEALQGTKNVYKDHIVLKNIVDKLCGYLYDSVSNKDKIKNITANEFMKALGCGFHLIQYLKTKLQLTTELDSEENLKNMLDIIESDHDLNEPLVKTPVDTNTVYEEVRQNFVKNRSDILNYLKKHYPVWQGYEEINNEMQVVRTFGRNLNMLKLERVRENEKRDENDVTKSTINKNKDFVMNVEYDQGNNDKVLENNTKDTPKNVGVFVLKETDVKEKDKLKIVEKNNVNVNYQNKTFAEDKSRNEASKPKIKSIFDFVVPKNSHNKDTSRDFHSVKVTIPNREIQNNAREKDANEFKIDKNSIQNKCVKKLSFNSNDDINHNRTKDSTNEDGKIKIIRNIHLIEEFERRLKEKETYDLDSSSIATTCNDFDAHINTNNDQNIDTKTDDQNCIDHTKCYKLNVHNYDENKNLTRQYNKDIHDTNNLPNKNHEVVKNQDDSKIVENYLQKHEDGSKLGQYDHIVNDRKDKGDVTNDSGLGSECSVYSLVKSFTSELESSLKHIQMYIDGSIKEIREGKLIEAKKKAFQLKAIRTNFLITIIIRRLEKLALHDDFSDKMFSINATIVSKCLKLAELLQNEINMILSVTNECSLVDISSSLSLNMS